MFTGAIKLANIDDYITPSQECIKPLMVPANQPVLVEPNILKASTDGKATVSLTDRLACSGCVTSAETILIQQMSIKQFKTKAKQGGCILLISPQSRVAIANYFRIDQKQILPRLELFTKKYFNVARVFEIVEGINLAHKLTAQQLTNQLHSETPHLPILSSQCPGWVCYAQKTTSPEVVSHMSQIKSPQQIMASLIRNQQKSHSFIVSIMPCYDKKLQAIRFTTPEGQKQVDLVLTSTQIIDLINNPSACNCSSSQCNCCVSSQLSLCKQQFIHSKLNQINYSNYYLTPQQQLVSIQDPKSNGYLHYMLDHLKAQNIVTKNIRNTDFIEYTVTIQGKQRKMAQCYGFRNIQNIVRQIKNNKCEYIYVEVMACPSGCVNGGGQPKEQGIKPKDIALKLQKQLKQIKGRLKDIQNIKQNNQQHRVKYKALDKNLNTVLNDW